jgi:hypothetical protein
MSIRSSDDASLSIQQFTSSEIGAWSNSYLIGGKSDAILFDVFMLASDAAQIADGIANSGKTLKTVMISHAHPDHFMGLEVITERFPSATVVSTANVVEDISRDGPWMLSLLQGKLGPEGPKRLVVPDILPEPVLDLEGTRLEVVEFGEGESKHNTTLYVPYLRALLSADLVYHDGHLYLQETSPNSQLGRITTAGVVTEYPVPSGPGGITAGPDGALWFTEDHGKIGRITTAGAITEYAVPTADSSPGGSRRGRMARCGLRKRKPMKSDRRFL